MQLRNHNPVVIEEFKGLWKNGRADSCPLNHFTEAENIVYNTKEFASRPGIEVIISALEQFEGNVVRMYNYKMQNGESLLILDSVGNIYHLLVGATEALGPILTVDGMTDFGFVAISGRAYITPFATFIDDNGYNYQKGLEDEVVYVYKGDGTAARPAAGSPPTNSSAKPFIAYNSQVDGVIGKGVHLIAVGFDHGILGPEVFPVVISPGDKQILLNNIPLGPPGTVTRDIAMTRAIDPKDYTSVQTAYTYYDVVTIPDNTTENLGIDISDAALTVNYVPGATAAPTLPTALEALNSGEDGYCDVGFHLFGVVFETDTGYLSAPGPEFFAGQTLVNGKKEIDIDNIPVSLDTFVTKRHIVATKRISDYNGDQIGYQFFFVPDGTIEDNTTTEKHVSFYDSDLLDDASHLIDNFEEIPAGVTLATYKGRMTLSATFEDISVCYLSEPGEPEAINQIDGLIIMPLDGRPITNAQEFRDVLYLFKQTRTAAFVDNGDAPSSWEPTLLEQGFGASVHGIATVLDSGGVNIDFLIVTNWAGIFIFNGAYTFPELSWKIETLWLDDLDRNEFADIQIVNDTVNKVIYMNLPDGTMLYGSYEEGLDAENIKWAKWTTLYEINTLAMIQVDKLALGSTGVELE
jgi:hypothetical protein